MKTPTIHWLVLLLIVSISWLTRESFADKVSAEFKFLVTPKRFYAVPFGSNFKVDCTTNDPNATTALYRRGSMASLSPWKLLTPSPRKLVKSGQAYTILDFGIPNAGQYKCRATNAAGITIEWPEPVNLIPNPSLVPPLNIDPIHAVVLTTGQSYNVTCSSVSSTTLQWYKRVNNSYEAVSSDKVYSETDSYLNKMVLMFKNVDKSEAGTYVCKMTYRRKRNFKYSVLQVYDKGSKPHLKGRTKTLTVNEPSGVVLSCSATGLPLPNITWYKGSNLIGCLNDGKPCGPQRQYTLRSKIKIKSTIQIVRSRLKISRTNKARDQGIYVCVASNRSGVAKRLYQLN